MNIKIQTNTFNECVHIASRFAERKSGTVSAFTAILITAKQKSITLRATNLEMSAVLTVPGEILEEGECVLPSIILKNITSSLSGGTVSLEKKGDTIHILSKSGKSTVKTLPTEDFPIVSGPEQEGVRFTIEGALLKQLIGTVAPCASASTIRPELASVLLCAEGGKLKAVATDSFRLIEKYIPLPAKVPTFTTLIPAKNAMDILQVIPDSEVEVVCSEHQGSFMWAGNSIHTRLVSAQYPDYVQIIPKTFIAEAEVSKKTFEEALRRVAVFSDSFQKITLGFDQKKKQITLFAAHSDIGESTESLDGSLSGESVSLSFNHRYIQTPISLIGTEQIVLKSAGIGRPLVILGAKDTGMLYLVMPMNQ